MLDTALPTSGTTPSMPAPLSTPAAPAVQPQPDLLGQPTQSVQPSMGRGESIDQVRKLGEQVEKAALPDALKENLLERVSRLALLRSSAGFMSADYILEYEKTSGYVNWVVGLPWHTMSTDILDLVKAKAVMDKRHYGLDIIKNRILDYMATIILNLKQQRKDRVQRAPILCLVGLAGTGKTTLAASIAEAMGKQFERIPFGGMADSRVLRGQSKAFPDAEPGSVVKKLVHAQTQNPVILLDELDRVTESARADIMGVLIELLDPEQNFAFTDHYVDFPFDLSNVLFVATANNTSNISTAVLDRLEIIQMPSYTDDEKMVIAKDYLYGKIRDDAGISPQQLIIDESVWPGIIRPLGFDSGIRSLERTIEGMCRKAAREIVEGKAQTVHISTDNLKAYLPSY